MRYTTPFTLIRPLAYRVRGASARTRVLQRLRISGFCARGRKSCRLVDWLTVRAVRCCISVRNFVSSPLVFGDGWPSARWHTARPCPLPLFGTWSQLVAAIQSVRSEANAQERGLNTDQ